MMTSLRSKWAAGKARGGRISKLIRNRRATQPPAHFQRNPLGRGQLAVFPRCSLGPYQFRYGRFARALKKSQLTYGDITTICETVHYPSWLFLKQNNNNVSIVRSMNETVSARGQSRGGYRWGTGDRT